MRTVRHEDADCVEGVELRRQFTPSVRAEGIVPDETLITGNFGQRFFLPITGINNRIQITDSFSYLFDSHDVKFGVDYNRVGLDDNSFIGFSRGQFLFGTLEDSLTAMREAADPILFKTSRVSSKER